MAKRTFNKPTEEELQRRNIMYAKAERLGINILDYDTEKPVEDEKQSEDIMDALLLLSQDKEIPKDLETRLLMYKETRYTARCLKESYQEI